MKNPLVLMAAFALVACGGGDSSPSDPTGGPDPAPSASLIRFEGQWRGIRFDSTRPVTPPATLTIRPLQGQATISSAPVARVEARLGQSAPMVLTAANATDPAGRPQFVFDFGQVAEPADCEGSFPTLQIAVTVVDTRGYTFTKHVATCVYKDLDFGAFSDHGSTSVQFSYSASAPITALIDRSSSSGDSDTLVAVSQAAFSAVLPAAGADRLTLRTNPAHVPPGTRVRSRIEAGGGTFAESTVVWPPRSQDPWVGLTCCGPTPAGSEAVDVTLRIRDFGTVPDATYSYSLQITDPVTGTVIGSQAGTTYSHAVIPVRVRRGHVIEMSATPNDPRVALAITAALGASGSFAAAASNEVGTPARFKVHCCQP